MDNIAPLDYITDIDPVDVTARDPTEWYDTTYIQIDTETTTDDQLVWLLAQGWVVYSITIHNYLGVAGETYYTWKLKRRVISGESVLSALIEDYTTAYNEGRTANDQRYDDIVAIYAAISDDLQDKMIELETDSTAFDALIETIITNIGTDFTSHDTEVSGDLDTYGTAQRTRIDTQFDAESTKAANSLISRGMYNTTVWDAVSAGVERERAIADNDFEDKLILQQINLEERLYQFKAQMRDRILTARDRLFAINHDSAMARESLREKIITALCSFMERRTDSYPDLTAIGNAAAELGAGTSITNVQP